MHDDVVRFYGCLKPIVDECFSSWLYRLAAYFNVQSTDILEIWQSRLRPHRLDTELSPQTLNRICEVTLLERWLVQETVLTANVDLALYKSRFCTNHALEDGPIYRFCPACLDTDPVPYIRKQWRLSHVRSCETHGFLLLEGCPSCGTKLNLSHKRRGRLAAHLTHPIRFCPICTANFGDLPRIKPDQTALDELTQDNEWLMRLLEPARCA